MIDSRAKKLDEIIPRLLVDVTVIKAIKKEFGNLTDSIVSALNRGKVPDVNGINQHDFLSDLLMNEPRKFKNLLG